METIISQITKELGIGSEYIKDVKIDESDHTVDFFCGIWYWAKLTKNNKNIRKNSIRQNPV